MTTKWRETRRVEGRDIFRAQAGVFLQDERIWRISQVGNGMLCRCRPQSFLRSPSEEEKQSQTCRVGL